MSAAPVLSRKIIGIDDRVWLTMLGMCLICLGLLGYQQITDYRLNDKPCISDTITVNGKSQGVAICYLDRSYRFALQTEGSAKAVWNFRDGTAKEKGPLAFHKFSKAGSYRVIASINRNCNFEVEVIVKNPFHLDPEKPEKAQVEIFSDVINPKVGSVVTFDGVPDISMKVSSYEWKLLNPHNALIQIKNDSAPTFTFNSPGTYNVHLMINNDAELIAKKTIAVEAVTQAPPPIPNIPSNIDLPGNLEKLVNDEEGNHPNNPKQGQSNQPSKDNNQGSKPDSTHGSKPALDSSKAALKSAATSIDENSFKDLLQNVIDESQEIEELYPYLDYKATTKVEVNGETPLINLTVFCRDMRSKKNNKIEAVTFKKDDNKSIQTIQVKTEEKGFFDKVKGWFKKKKKE